MAYDAPEAPQPFDFVEFFAAVIRQQFATIAAVTLLAIAGGFFYVFTAVPVYTARATIIIDSGKTQAQVGDLLREIPVGSMEAESQIQLMKSESVALAVIKKLNLTEDPEFIPPPKSETGWFDRLRSSLGRVPTPPDSTQLVLASIARGLSVTHAGGNVIVIEYKSTKPSRAAEVANAFADAYITDQLDTRDQSARQTGDWLQGRLKELGNQSALADEAVVQFKAKNNIVAAGGTLISEQQLAALNAQLVLAREKTAEARAKLDRIDAIINEDPASGKTGGAVAEALTNPIIVKLRAEYLELVNREADWSRRFGKDHMAVVNLNRQMREIRTSIATELRQIAESYKSDYEIAKQRQTEAERTVAEAVATSQNSNQAQSELRRLENSADTYRGLYKSALQRNTELGQQESFRGTEARLITRASAPLQKSGPRNSIILLASAAGGVMLGFGLGMLRMTLDGMFRTSGQVEAALQAECLALVPLLKPSKVSPDAPVAAEPRTIQRSSSPVWQVVDRPLARFAEAMRSVKSAADVSARPVKVLGFTSSLPREGKSLNAASFALLAAQSGVKTILLDCDLRHPALTRILAPNAENGLLEFLSGKKTLEEVLWTEPDTKLAFLPGAMQAKTPNSSDILASAELRQLITELRKTYDYVVVDLPPTAPIVDVRSTSGLIDAYCFVVAWAQTKVRVAEFALEKTPIVRANLLGIILNKVDFSKLGRYDSHRSDYYSDKYYSQYGDV